MSFASHRAHTEVRAHPQVARNCGRDPSNNRILDTKYKRSSRGTRIILHRVHTLAIFFFNFHTIQLPPDVVQRSYYLPRCSTKKKSVQFTKIDNVMFADGKLATTCLLAFRCRCPPFFYYYSADGNEMTETGSFGFLLPLCQRQPLSDVC